MTRILLCMALVACSSRGGSPTGTSGGGGGNAASCAPTMQAMKVGEKCSGQTSCSYPDGDCFCGSQSYCGGIAPTEEMLADLRIPRWQCKAKRTDGCPDVEPQGPCAEEGKVCSYGDCCVSTSVCKDGTWAAGMPSCPP